MWGNNLKGPILCSLSIVYGLIVRCKVLVGWQLTIALSYTRPSPSVKTAVLVHRQDYLAKRQFGEYRSIIRGEGQHLSDMTDVVLHCGFGFDGGPRSSLSKWYKVRKI